MTDEELERRLREWYRSEVSSDETAPLSLRSRLAAIPRASTMRDRAAARRRGITLLAAAALVGLAAGTAAVGAFLGRDPAPEVLRSASPEAAASPGVAVVVSPGPIATAPIAAPSASSGPCFTDTMEVLPGDAMRAYAGGNDVGEKMPGLGSGFGVYQSSIGGIRSGGLWAIGPGAGPARAISLFTPAPFVLNVLDVSPDGSTALVRAGNTHRGVVPAEECVDLFMVRTDGSGATRLAPFKDRGSVGAAAFSPDGGRVAYTWNGQSPSDGGTMTVLDVGTGQAVDQPCKRRASFSPDSIAWSPTGDRIALHCNGILTIFEPGGTTAPVPSLWGADIVMFGWTDGGDLLIATVGGDIRSLDITSEASTSVGRFDFPADIELVFPSGGFSPDGRWMVLVGGEPGSVPGDGFRTADYLVRTSGGTPIRINEDVPFTFSGDSRALVAQYGNGFGRLDLETLKWSRIGPSPGLGVWRIP